MYEDELFSLDHRIDIFLEEMHSSVVLSLLVFSFEVASWSWCECREKPVGPGTDHSPAGGV